MPTLFSVGYGHRKFEDFVELLQRFSITYLVDVRSKPFSKYRPEFSKDRLESLLKIHDIKYVFLGHQLGGMPDDPSCYNGDWVDYSKIREKEFFKLGLQRLVSAADQRLPLTIMCAESKPQGCHRTRLIGEALRADGVELKHIDENDQLRPHDEVMAELNGPQIPLF
jgi:uncharacterized protein (DUF488 family)